MTPKNTSGKDEKAVSDRKARLKAALKANLQRRKAQTRARTTDTKNDKAG